MRIRGRQRPSRRQPRTYGTPHVPMRTCAGCRARAPKEEMMRFGRTGPAPEPPAARGRKARGTAAVGWMRSGGRGAYLHPHVRCIEQFVGSPKPVFGLRVSLSRETRQALVDARPISIWGEG